MSRQTRPIELKRRVVAEFKIKLKVPRLRINFAIANLMLRSG